MELFGYDNLVLRRLRGCGGGEIVEHVVPRGWWWRWLGGKLKATTSPKTRELRAAAWAM